MAKMASEIGKSAEYLAIRILEEAAERHGL
jgi:hypothetical protein